MTAGLGAAIRALTSLRGAPTNVVPPSHAAVRYRASAFRGIAPLADLYVPAHPRGASVVLVHGGGFVIGSRGMKPMRLLASRLSAAGIATCVIDYRLIFRGGRLDHALDDVCAAFAFWHERAPHFGFDPDEISLVGLSAGASLAMLAAGRPELSRLSRLVCCFGLYDTGDLRGPVAGLWARLVVGTSDRATWAARSPRGAAQPVAPTLLLHGADDDLVPAAQARRIAAHRAGLGLATRLVIYPGAAHGFFHLPGPAAEAGVREIIDHVARGAASARSTHADPPGG